MMNKAILESGVNLIDSAEQYPIPSGPRNPEGLAEATIGKWINQEKGRREKVVIATKITGGGRITGKNIISACEGSLKRLGTDYIDLYQFHWPARYTPQSNWGQSLSYYQQLERRAASFEEQCEAMGKLIEQGKIRGWGSCNDNTFGLTMLAETAKRMGLPPPSSMQNDFSLINRRVEQDGVAEASSPIHENTGLLAYNCLAGGVLTNKYYDSDSPPAWDDFQLNPDRAKKTLEKPRGRHDDLSWGGTLYRYRTAAAKDATMQYAAIAKKAGMPLTEMALRWAREREYVTSVLLGTSNVQQLEQDLAYFRKKEALPDSVMQAIDAVHMRNRLPIFSSNRYQAEWANEGEIGEVVP